jgi:hypothetical protein
MEKRVFFVDVTLSFCVTEFIQKQEEKWDL